jgi:hypothetical protein
MTYEAAEKAKAVAKDQRALAEQVKSLQQTAAALEQQLKQAGALDSSLARQLQEAQAMLRDALTPELLAQMKKLDNATQQLSHEQAQQSLKICRRCRRSCEQLEKSAENAEARGPRGDGGFEGRGEGHCRTRSCPRRLGEVETERCGEGRRENTGRPLAAFQ